MKKGNKIKEIFCHQINCPALSQPHLAHEKKNKTMEERFGVVNMDDGHHLLPVGVEDADEILAFISQERKQWEKEYLRDEMGIPSSVADNIRRHARTEWEQELCLVCAVKGLFAEPHRSKQ